MKKFLLLFLFPVLASAQTLQSFKTFLSGSPSASAITGTELMYCDQSNASVKCTPSQLLTYVQANITTVTCANPTGTVGLTTVNGSATTCMRSDASPPISQAISPNWTALHTWTPSGVGGAINLNVPTNSAPAIVIAVGANTNGIKIATGNSAFGIVINGTTTTSDSFGLQVNAGTNSSDEAFSVVNAAKTLGFLTVNGNGTIDMPQLPSSSSAATGTMCWTTSTGNITIDTTTTCLASTRKIKENIAPLNAGLAEVMKLRPVSYNLKTSNNPMGLGTQVGLISEDVAQIDSRLVSLDGDHEPLGVRYMQLTAVLTKAIQEQQKEIEELKHPTKHWWEFW